MESIPEFLSVVINTIILIVPWFLFFGALHIWLMYRRLKYQYNDLNPVLLEIKIPAEIYKSPRAMEIIFSALYQKNDGTLWEVFWDGKTRPHFSFEIVSIGGAIHFFIWTPPKFRKMIESNFYSQYPGIEIEEIVAEEDYTRQVSWNPDKLFMWGTYWKLKESDPVPIATYNDYKLEDNPKEEEKIDPFSSTIEYLGGLSYGEQAWIQFVFSANSGENWKSGNHYPFFPKEDHKTRIDEYIKNLKKEATTVKTSEDGDAASFITYEPGKTDAIKRLRGLQGKFAFNVFIRGVYISQHETFNNGNISGLIGTMQQFSHAGANGFKLGSYSDISDNKKDVLRTFPLPPLKNYWERKRAEMEREFLAAYKRRSGFHPPHRYHGEAPPLQLTTEELATLYHLPGTVVTTPSLERIGAQKSNAPTNLPL